MPLGKIRIAKKILDDLKIPFWLDCGTLLFVVRENRLDPQDIDFSIMEKDGNKLLSGIHNFLERGFTIHRVYTHPKFGLTEISLRLDGLALDIFIRHKVGNYLVGITQYDSGYVAWGQPIKYFKKFSKRDFDGKRYNVPNNVENYLACYFGENWRTPKPDWDSSKDAPCLDEGFLT